MTTNPISNLDEVDLCLRAFSNSTGWGTTAKAFTETRSNQMGPHLTQSKVRRWQIVDNIVRTGTLDGEDLTTTEHVSMEQAGELLASIERLVQRLDVAEAAIRRQEAELATSLVVTSHPDRQHETADRLESILDSSSRSIGAVAAAIYLLDDDTSSLKMRACLGLPTSRLAQPPRPLRGSLADLEALLGNAVLLSDIEMMPEWPSPEEFASAIVVPIGSSTMPHGTMWFWSTKTRSYSATEIEVVNLAAGRVMSEIEQSILGQEVHQSRAVQKQINTASLTQASMLPDTQILHEDFDLSGWTHQQNSIGGGFHCWDIIPSGMMAMALGNAEQTGPEGCLVATSAQAVIQTLWTQGQSPSQILRAINDSHWSRTEANWIANLAMLQINPSTGYGSICNAGDMQSYIVSSRGFRPIGVARTAIGRQPDTDFSTNRFVLQPGEIFVSFTSGILNQLIAQDPSKKSCATMPVNKKAPLTLDQSILLGTIRDMCDETANDIAGFIARWMPASSTCNGNNHDRSFVLIKNIRKAIK